MRLIKELKFEILFICIFVITRLPDLGYDVFNTDVWKWKARSYDFSTGVFTLNFEKTIQKYHPGVTLMWLGTAAIKVYNFYLEDINSQQIFNGEIISVFQLHFVQKLFVVIAIGFALSLCFYVLRKIFDLEKAVFLLLILSFEPFYIALTRVFHLEGLMSTFMLASYLWLYYFTLNTSKKKRLIVSAIAAGLGLLTKTSALFMLPYAGLILFLNGWKSTEPRRIAVKNIFKYFVIWLTVFLATFILIWPAMWTNPVEAISAMYRGVAEIGIEREHIQFYFGKLVEDPGSSFYFVVLGLRSSILLILGLLGLVVTRRKIITSSNKKFILYSFVFVIFYFIQLTIPSKKLDRYILPEILVLSFLSSLFWISLFDRFKKYGMARFLPLVVLAVAPVFYLHPDYLSYYNPMFGGLKTGIRVLEPKWMIGGREVVSYFNNKAEEQNLTRFYGSTSLEEIVYGSESSNVLLVGFPEKYYTQIWPFFRQIGGYAVIEDLTPFAVKTKYFVYPVWDDTSSKELRFGLKYIDTIKLRNTEIYKVYERIPL